MHIKDGYQLNFSLMISKFLLIIEFNERSEIEDAKCIQLLIFQLNTLGLV